ncbi:MAG TPA: PA14 domain-containing protein [Verrucomicrobiae bacterium]
MQVTRLVTSNAVARVHIPTNGNLGLTWSAKTFNDSGWQAATNGVGYETYVPGFSVRNIIANSSVCDLTTALAVLDDPARQTAVFTANPAVVNYLNTGSGEHFGNDATLPGLTINVDQDNYVTEATGVITIPTSTNWTFGVNSDDGFRVTLGSYTFDYPAPRAPGDSFATFYLPAGDYPVRLVFYECGGGSEVEFFAAPGSFGSWTSGFALVGAPDGLPVKCLPGSAATATLRPLISTDVQAQMAGRSSSAYARIPFTLTDPAVFTSLTLRMKYNDAYVAYLNGTEVARANFSGTPQWNSVATQPRSVANALTYEDVDLTSRLGLLQAGANVLAIQGLNDSVAGSQFVVLAELLENKLLGISTNHYFGTPTPGTFNSLDYVAFVSDLKFSPDRGFFLNTNISVTVTSATPGVTIRYTRDGSAPTTTTGQLYTGAIPINTTTTLRVIGYRDGFQPSIVETHTYVFLDAVQRQSTNVNYVGGSSGDYTLSPAVTQTPPYRDTFTNDLLSVPTLSISVAWEDFFGPNGIWSNPQGQGVAWERPCSAEYIRTDGKKGFSVNCGLRVQGGVSRTMVAKHSLRLLFKSMYGPGKLKYDLYPDSPVQEFDTLSLHAGFNDQWLWLGAGATLQRDLFCRETQNATGGYAGHGTYAHLYVNGLYWGLYNIGEKSDDSFAASYLGGEKEEYDAFTADEQIAGTPDAWNAMLAIADAGITTDTAYTNLSRYLDVPNFINYMLMNFYVANVDWPYHNWTAARRRVTGAGFCFFSWDAEWVLGVGSDPSTDRTGIGSGDGAPGRLYAGLRSHPEFRRLFGDLAQKHCFNGGALSPAVTSARWEARTLEIDRAIVGEAARWGGGTYTRETWLTAEDQVRSWFPQRTATLIAQLRNAGLFPQLNAPGLIPFGGLVVPASQIVLTNPNTSGSIYYTTDGSDPRLWGGALASSARLCTGPLTITNATFVRARVRSGTEWSALLETPFYIIQDFRPLAITELMFNPPNLGSTNGDQFEFLELKNTGTNVLDLSGLQFTDGITFAFTNQARLSPGQFFVLVRNPAAFAMKYPGVRVDGVYTGKLDNAGEKVTLAHVLGTNIYSFTYNQRPPWPVTPDGYGFSLVRADPAGDPGFASSWRASTYPGGSPGADDPPPNIAPVVINEILTHTDPPQADTIELYNPTPTNAPIGGWFLSDDAAAPKKFRIPDGTIIPPHGFAVFTEADFNPTPGVPPSFVLNSWGESVYVFSGDASTDLTGYNHGLEYGPAANGVSFGRYVISTGEEQWPAQTVFTPGTNNAGPRIGPVVINEILYHPAPGYDEFLELYNLSGASVPLYDPAFPTNGWHLNGLGYSFPSGTTLTPGAFMLLVPIDPAVFRAKYNIAPTVQILGPYPGTLQDSGERLRLERPDAPDTNGVAYIVVDEVRYNDKAPWPPGANGDGPSLQRHLPIDYGNEPTNWFASGITTGALNAFNLPPTCTLVSPADGSVYTAPVAISLRATGVDLDGTIARIEYYDSDVKIAEVTNLPYTFTWTNASIGTHRLLAKARDSSLAVGVSAAVTITVNPPPVGNGTGLQGDYYDNIDFTGTLLRRTDPVVNFNWDSGSPDPSIGADTFSVRWTGKVQPRYTGTFTFYTTSDDGIRLWVNNQIVINNWTDHAPTENAGSIALQAGRFYDIKMEFYENGGGAVAQLSWSGPNVPKEIIPTTQLYLPSTQNQPPTITLSNPSPGSTFVSGSTINVGADAFDPDGSVARVDFYSGASKLGTVTTGPYICVWSNALPGNYPLSAVATDNGGLSSTSAPVAISVVAGVVTNIALVDRGSLWSYRDTGENLGSGWPMIAFNDTAWSTGHARLGYGNGGESTPIGYGPNPSAKYITTYFRQTFTIADPTVFQALNLNVLRDDGVIVYVNGSPVYRNNMPADPVGYLTLALTNATGIDATNQYYTVAIDPGYLVFGTNAVAAEMHLCSAAAPSLNFDLQLTGTRSFIAPAITTPPQSQSASAGSAAGFSVVAQGTAPLAYQWRFNGTELAGATDTTLLLPYLVPEQAGSYSVRVSNPGGSVTSLPATLTVTAPDSDGDGMPDYWEIAHGLNPQINDANLDPDHDGMSNLLEYLAGTDPHDPNSVFRLDLLSDRHGSLSLQFQAISNRTYTVQSSTGFGAWAQLTNVPAATTNRGVVVPVLPADSHRYYRLATP